MNRAFVEAGYRVATTYTNPQDWESLGDLRKKILALEADIPNARAAEGAVRRTAEEFGGLYALVNLVGGFAGGTLARTPEETWDRMMDLKSAFLITRAAFKHMPDAGRIVNVGTAAVTNKVPRIAAYVASKGGLTSLTERLANELKKHRITVNAVLPTVIDTPANRSAMPNANRSSRLLPKEVAEVVLFLASALR